MPHVLRLRTAGPSHREVAEIAVTPSAHPAHGLRGWWARNVAAMDPHPETGTLDRLDHATTVDRFRPEPLDPTMQQVA